MQRKTVVAMLLVAPIAALLGMVTIGAQEQPGSTAEWAYLGSCDCAAFAVESSRWGGLARVHIENADGIWDGYWDRSGFIPEALRQPSAKRLSEMAAEREASRGIERIEKRNLAVATKARADAARALGEAALADDLDRTALRLLAEAQQ